MTTATPLRLILAAALALLAAAASAQEPQPHPQTGLDHRVLTRPGATLVDAPDGSPILRPSTFSAYYVFGDRDVDGTPWLEVRANRTVGETAWLPAAETVDWKQTIVLGFTNPADRLPAMFFEDREALIAFVKDEAMSTRAELLAMSFQSGQGAGDSGVVSLEPAEHIDLTQQFYMLPILNHDRVRVNRRPKRILEIASINRDDPGAPVPQTTERFKVGIVFVIDTSTSMGPYIDATKDAVRELIGEIREADAEADFSFGMVGFRSSTQLVPGLEYTSKVYHPLEPEFDEAAFLASIGEMDATTISSHDFDEDGLSGIVEASEMGTWDSFGGRYVIFISDAGLLVGQENGASSEVTPQLLATRLSGDLGVATFAMQLRTRAGRAYHDDAAAQLEALTYLPSTGRSYVFPIEGGDVGAFRTQVSDLTEALLQNVAIRQASQAGTPPPDPCADDPTSIACAVAGPQYAMELAWLGSQGAVQAPDTYRAWAPDFALDDPRRLTMSPRVLLTRAQLNDVYVTLQAIVEAYQQSPEEDPLAFFRSLKTILARVMRDPSTLQALDAGSTTSIAQAEDFEDLGDLLGAHLQNLPYESDLAQITEETWGDPAAVGTRHEFIEGLKAKLSIYELYYADTDNWIALSPDADESERVYPLPMEMMP